MLHNITALILQPTANNITYFVLTQLMITIFAVAIFLCCCLRDCLTYCIRARAHMRTHSRTTCYSCGHACHDDKTPYICGIEGMRDVPQYAMRTVKKDVPEEYEDGTERQLVTKSREVETRCMESVPKEVTYAKTVAIPRSQYENGRWHNWTDYETHNDTRTEYSNEWVSKTETEYYDEYETVPIYKSRMVERLVDEKYITGYTQEFLPCDCRDCACAVCAEISSNMRYVDALCKCQYLCCGKSYNDNADDLDDADDRCDVT